MDAIVLTLMVHSQLCENCSMGTPCTDARRLHDLCIERDAQAAAARVLECISLIPVAA